MTGAPPLNAIHWPQSWTDADRRSLYALADGWGMSDAPILKDAAIKLGHKPENVRFLTGLSANTMRARDAHVDAMRAAETGGRSISEQLEDMVKLAEQTLAEIKLVRADVRAMSAVVGGAP